MRPKQVKFYRNIVKDLGISDHVDLILSNPPWLPASYLTACSQSPLDNAVYDPNEKFLISSLNFAKFHMDPSTGQMLLIYSDLAQNLGLQEPNRLPQLADQFGLRIDLLDETNIPLSKKQHDPLKMIKRQSKI